MSQLRFAHSKPHSFGLGFFSRNSLIRVMLRRHKISLFHSCPHSGYAPTLVFRNLKENSGKLNEIIILVISHFTLVLSNKGKRQQSIIPGSNSSRDKQCVDCSSKKLAVADEKPSVSLFSPLPQIAASCVFNTKHQKIFFLKQNGRMLISISHLWAE